MSIKISQWSGRLGNNLIQISSALKLCEEKSTNLHIPSNLGILDSNFFEITKKDSNYEKISDFWGVYMSDDERRKLCQKYLKNKIKFTKINLDTDDFVIHARGGDIFIGTQPGYVQAPISYISNILKNNNYKNIFLVFEDYTNPIVNYIKDNFKNVNLINNLQEGINYILSCKTLILTGISSFPRMLSMCNESIKNIYVPFFEKNNNDYINECNSLNILPYLNPNNSDYFFYGGDFIEFTDINVIKINIENYIKYGEWGWSDENKRLLFIKN